MEPLKNIQLIICDVDDTLVVARSTVFYAQYGRCVERAIAKYFGVALPVAVCIANAFRADGEGAERALFSGDITRVVAEAQRRAPNYSMLYDAMSALNPEGEFTHRAATQQSIEQLARKGVKVIALTSSPTTLSKKILEASGYTLASFADIIGYERESGPPKMVDGAAVFRAIAHKHGVAMSEVMAIGDKPEFDVLPAVAAGATGCVIDTSVEDVVMRDGILYTADINNVFKRIQENGAL